VPPKGFLPWLSGVWGRVHFAYRLLLPCRFAILVLAVVLFLLIVTEQGPESLRVMAEFGDKTQPGSREPYLIRLLLFLTGAILFSGASWYFSRQAFLLIPPPELRPRQGEILFRWSPRVLGVLALASPALALWVAADQYDVDPALQQVPSPRLLLRLLAVFFFLLSLAFGVFVWKRRALFQLPPLTVPERGQRVKQLPGTTQRVIWLSVLVTLVLFGWIIVDPIGLTAFIATPTVILFCSAIWVFAGTMLVISASRIRLPLFTALLLLLLLSSRSNDNHRVRPIGKAPPRPDLAQATRSWISWMDAHYPDEGRHPLFLVATEGGGLRAAYWTAAILSEIQKQFPAFSDHCFAISGVSGGSLGAAVFSGLLAAKPTEFRKAAGSVLSRDFLAPTTARMLGADLPQQFLFLPILPDRADAIERAWQNAWVNAFPGAPRDAFSRPFLDLFREHRPLLFLNGTEVETGRRVIFSPINVELPEDAGDPFAFKNAEDGIEMLGGDLSASGAVLMSARFTYVSPAGTVHSRRTLLDGTVRQSVHRIVDGGYFENSGAATAFEILEFLQSAGPWRNQVAPHVILITHSEKLLPSSEFLSEELAPLRALFATRVARGDGAVAELRAAAGNSLTKFDLKTDQGVPLPLGWLLSAQARRAIDDAVDRSDENQAATAQIGSVLTFPPIASPEPPAIVSSEHVPRPRPASRSIASAIQQIVQGH
jgi:hypothetical protein